jgi:hypothetical protein
MYPYPYKQRKQKPMSFFFLTAARFNSITLRTKRSGRVQNMTSESVQCACSCSRQHMQRGHGRAGQGRGGQQKDGCSEPSLARRTTRHES